MFAILPFQTDSEAARVIKDLKFLVLNGRKEAGNKMRTSKVCKNFGAAKTSTSQVPRSAMLWTSQASIASEVAALGTQLHCKSFHSEATREPLIDEAAKDLLSRFRNGPRQTLAVEPARPLEVSKETATLVMASCLVNNYTIETFLMVTSINTQYTTNHKLLLIRRGLATLAFPIPDPITDHNELLAWAEDLTEMNHKSLVPYFEHGLRECYVRVLSRPVRFGFDTSGENPALIHSHSYTEVLLTAQEVAVAAKFHPDSYTLHPYPTVTCTAVPAFGEKSLMSNPASVLLYVRGVGENHDAHNILIPLVLDNLLHVTQLERRDIFALPIVIQARHPVKKDNLHVLVEENVIAIMYNPDTVSSDKKSRVLQLLALADSSVSSCVSLRGIPIEYIAHPDVLLTKPSPNPECINMFMIPMRSGASGTLLMQLLITVGAVDPTTLLHFTVLPANQQARQEFRHQRLYVFLTMEAFFLDALAFNHPNIQAFLSPKSQKRIFRSEYLPGITAALHHNGKWSQNRKILESSTVKPQVVGKQQSWKPPNIQGTSYSPTEASEPSAVSSASSTLIPGNLSSEFEMGSQVAVMQRHLVTQQSMIIQQAQDTRSLLEKTDQMVTAIERLTSHLIQQTLSSGANEGPDK